jgi:DNA-binding response OmpR family regulator
MPKVLLIDDDPEARATVTEMLTALGHQVIEAMDGREGTRVAIADRPDLVICDIIMPEQEGIATIRELLRTHPGLLILPITGRGSFYLGLANKFGAQVGLQKPFGIVELQNSIARLLTPGTPT